MKWVHYSVFLRAADVFLGGEAVTNLADGPYVGALAALFRCVRGADMLQSGWEAGSIACQTFDFITAEGKR